MLTSKSYTNNNMRGENSMMEVSAMKASNKESETAVFAAPVAGYGSCERREPPVKVKRWKWYNINRRMMSSKYLFIWY